MCDVVLHSQASVVLITLVLFAVLNVILFCDAIGYRLKKRLIQGVYCSSLSDTTTNQGQKMNADNRQQGNGVKLFEKGMQSFYYVPYFKNGVYKIKKFQSSMGKSWAYKLACDFSLNRDNQNDIPENIFTSSKASITLIPFIIQLKFRKPS